MVMRFPCQSSGTFVPGELSNMQVELALPKEKKDNKDDNI